MISRESSEAATTLAPASDANLVARAQRGEEAAFASLFQAHKRGVYSLCLRMTHSPADAEDLTQEAFLQVFRKIATFRGESTFSTWLHRLVLNRVLMHLRKKRLPEVSLDELNTSLEEPAARQYRDDDQRVMVVRGAFEQGPHGFVAEGAAPGMFRVEQRARLVDEQDPA